MITIKDLIIKLLEYNPNATVSINGLYEESEQIYFSWIGNDSTTTEESKKECTHLFLETEYKNQEIEEKE